MTTRSSLGGLARRIAESVPHEPRHPRIVVRTRTDLSYDEHDVEIVDPEDWEPDPTDTPDGLLVRQSFFSLHGPMGVLPDSYTDRIADSVGSDAENIRAVLDALSQPIFELLLRAEVKHTPSLSAAWYGQDDPFTVVLKSLTGVAPSQAQGDFGFSPSHFVYFAGQLANHRGSLNGLARNLEELLERRPIDVRGFLPVRRALAPEEQTRLPPPGTLKTKHQTDYHNRLGEGAILGNYVVDAQGSVAVTITLKTLEDYHDLLPDGRGHQVLSSFARVYLGLQYRLRLHLVLEANAVPPAQCAPRDSIDVHDSAGCRLGWDTWLPETPVGPRNGAEFLILS